MKRILIALATLALGVSMAVVAPGPSAPPINPEPAAASTCVIQGGHLYTLSNGESACARILIQQIVSAPNNYWISWWVQDVTDWGSDGDLAVISFKECNTGCTLWFLGSDQNSADYNVSSGFSYRTKPPGGILNAKGVFTIHGSVATNYMPVEFGWVP